ncbi:MAG: acetyl ornithine aminotransferase family protein, partial [Planctomycetaceae bacterium]|nr:acetyl ornithine aminotransferase family protein [Planctomycetaceae bacterium]
GPRAAKLIASDEQYTSPSYTRVYPLAVARGAGAMIEDLDGNCFLDFTAGIAVCATGHCHPQIVQAIVDQSQSLLHMSGTDFYYGPQQQLAERLAQLAPGDTPKKVFFGNSGAEAIEAALKLSRWHTDRKKVLAFYGAFHGRTCGALSLTASKVTQKRRFGPLLPDILHVEYPNPYRGPSVAECFLQIEKNIFGRVAAPDEFAAIVVEPIQGEGGYIVPPPEFLPRLAELAKHHGILLVADEVQSGMGRTGKMFAVEHWGVEPDIICLAKGIASGMPLGAIVARSEVMNWPPGSHASTFGGNPVCCAAALATISLLESELMQNATVIGEVLIGELRQLAHRHAIIGDVRGRGLMIGMELVEDRESKVPAKQKSAQLIQRCFQKGLLLLSCGESTIRFCPPLVITHEQVHSAIHILDEVLTEIP